MPELIWIRRLVVPARGIDGSASRAIVGVLETESGPQRALQIGHDNAPVLLPRQAMDEFTSHCRSVIAENIPEDKAGR